MLTSPNIMLPPTPAAYHQ